MKIVVCKIMILILIALTITACTSKLSYKENSGDPASPGDSELVFILRNSTILISQSGTENKTDDGKQAADQKDLSIIVNSCPAKKGQEEITPPISSDNCLSRCLFQVTAKVIAARDTSAFYVAQPAWGTTLKSTAVDDDPLMVKKIEVDYKNPMTGAVSSAGAGAVAGFGMGGPWGAAIGGLLGGVAQAVSREPIKKEEWVEKTVCTEDRKDENYPRFGKLKPADNNNAPQLFLPVALSYENSRSETECWHPLPNRSHEVQESEMEGTSQSPTSLSGWFYRIVPVDPKLSKINLPPVLPKVLPKNPALPFQKREEYFGIAGNQETFPISACRSVEVQITWWELLKKTDTEVKHYKYPTMVANSEYVQAVRLPQNGTVYLLPVCGGYASPTQSSSSLGELIDEIVKQASAIKEAQGKYKEAQTKKE